MKKILNALFLTIITLVTFSCSDVPAPYDIEGGGNGEGPALTGDGTKENPYDIASAMTKQDNSEAWVMGYIVGCINDKSISTDAVFAPPFTNPANILIAADADETDYKKCIPVQLVSQTDVRAALNLVDNGANLGKAVVIKGQLTKYFGVAGLKNPTAAVLDGKDIGDGSDPEPGDKDNPLGLDDSKKNNTFSADFEDLLANNDYELEGWYNVAIEGGRRWQGKTFNNTTTGKTDKYIQATSYGGTGDKFECWFATPAFEVDQVKDKKVSFDCAVYNYATASANSKLEVYFLQLVDGKMVSTPINVAGMPTTDNTWVTLTADLSAQSGKIGFVGFKYTSTSSSEALSYRLDNIKAGAQEGEIPGEDDPFDLNVSDVKESFTVDFEDMVQDQTYVLSGWVNKGMPDAYTWKGAAYNSDKYIRANTKGADKGSTVESWFITPAFVVNASKKLTFDCAGANWAANPSLKIYFLQKSVDGKLSRHEIAMEAIPTSGTNYTWVKDIEVNLSSYVGQTGFIGFQYMGTEPETGGMPTYQLDNIKYGEGGEEPNPGDADGTIDKFGGTGQDVKNTVVLIADSKGETDYTKCVAVNLPTGDLRTAVNLQDNPENVGKKLTIKGKFRTYFGIGGLRDVNKSDSYKLE
ncbi:DUF6359 domain-containing protein [Bacteroides faecis]|uniref:DUF6359 domain-containing protein n=1 Tax=Bacteroides faecis TaxID=674529 RepID=UPI0032BF9DCC